MKRKWFRLSSVKMLQVKNFVKCFVRPLNARYSRKSILEDTHPLIRQTLDEKVKLTPDDCHELREKVLQCVPKRSAINVDQIILANCRPHELSNGKSYVNYLKKSGQELEMGTLTNLLKLYYRASKHGTELTAEDQQDIIDMSVL